MKTLQFKKGSLKFQHAFFFLFLVCFFSSCGPSIHYLGDSYEPTHQPDIFYSIDDVKHEYKVMGKMTNDKFINYDADIIRKEMIKEAKKRGADGIIFDDIEIDRYNDTDGDKLGIKAALIKYI